MGEKISIKDSIKGRYRSRFFNNIDAVFKKAKGGTKIMRVLSKYLKELYILEEHHSSLILSNGEKFATVNESQIPLVANAIGKICTSIMANGRQGGIMVA